MSITSSSYSFYSTILILCIKDFPPAYFSRTNRRCIWVAWSANYLPMTGQCLVTQLQFIAIPILIAFHIDISKMYHVYVVASSLTSVSGSNTVFTLRWTYYYWNCWKKNSAWFFGGIENWKTPWMVWMEYLAEKYCLVTCMYHPN